MNGNTIKWLFSPILFIIGILLILLYFSFEEAEFSALFGLTGIVVAAISVGLFLRFHDSNKSIVNKLAEEFKFKFQLDDIYVSNDLSGVIGVSNEKKILYLMTRFDLITGLDIVSDHFKIDAFPFKDIRKINIIENDNIILKSTDKNLIGKSVRGGFGNDGVQKKNIVHKVRIQVITDDVIKPTSDVFIYNSGVGFKRNSDEYNNFYKTISKWLNHINHR